MIIYATGFDAITGDFDRIDIGGVGGTSLKDKWADGPVTFLGILADGFPNFLMVMGPHALFGNFPRQSSSRRLGDGVDPPTGASPASTQNRRQQKPGPITSSRPTRACFQGGRILDNRSQPQFGR